MGLSETQHAKEAAVEVETNISHLPVLKQRFFRKLLLDYPIFSGVQYESPANLKISALASIPLMEKYEDGEMEELVNDTMSVLMKKVQMLPSDLPDTIKYLAIKKAEYGGIMDRDLAFFSYRIPHAVDRGLIQHIDDIKNLQVKALPLI